MSDEVGAIVLDLGSHTLRGGFAGEDTPKIDMPSYVGCISPKGDSSVTKRIIGTNIYVPYERMEITSFVKEGLIEDWDVFEDVVSHIINFLIPVEKSQHPILLSEPSWNPKLKREKLTEILFEKFEVPAFYLAKSAALACFANGRHTGLVLDCGASCASAVPVYDGRVLLQGVVRTPLAGDFIARQCAKLIKEELKTEPIPYYRVAAKDPVKDREAPRWIEKKLPPLTDSFKSFMEQNLMEDFAATVLQISDERYDQGQMETIPTISYEFPNGYNVELGHERFQIPEALFDPSVLPQSGGSSELSMSHIVSSSISLCDIDIRPNLYNNIVVVGGTSLIVGFTDRLQRDLGLKTPSSMRLKVNFPSSLMERRFSNWVGGSILGSLGTFQQMWISRHEYEEFGKSIIEKKCS
ncbi:actin 6a [Echinococcus multilocularis]|uniref:Actin 6a n=1 Tax=Echinococcus multilocularis TaxID=6211 RepID=A0A068Y1J2_ECHMU|nr:actin 6a [Echinococcus multilocularis]